ncbi:MAG: M48 family metalloprotease [Nitrospirae bacterium]|nr:M48 family metalloprotease [Nitrospirota bacterium]
MLVSEEQEVSIGKNASPSLKWEFGGSYEDRALETYLGTIVKDLWKNSERPNLPVEFHIQNTSLPNAFALPGYVAITRGLLSEMENEAQFAAVMGHEIGHVMARHTAKRISRMQLQQVGIAIGAAALQGSKGGDALLAVGAAGSSLLLLKYDRDQEIQSDRLGVKYMSALGYDPHEALSAHKVLEKSVDNYIKKLGKSREEDSFVSNLLSTHPRAEVRLSEIQDMINQLPPYTIKGDGKFGNRFQTETKKINEINKIYHVYDKAEQDYRDKKYGEAEKGLQEAIKLNGSQAPFYNLLGFIKLQQKNYEEADKAFGRALAVSPGFQPSIYGRGLSYLYKGSYENAILEFKKSLDEFPGHAQSHYGLGKSYYHINKYSEAIPYLANFAQAMPEHPEIHGLLGICLDKTNDQKSAVIEYKNQLQVAPDTELGRHARKRLEALEPALKVK